VNILIALTYYRPHYSGLTIHAEREARALAARGHQVTVLTSRFDPQLPAVEVQDGVKIIRPRVWFHISKGVIMPGMPFSAWRLIRQSDVLHLHVPQFDAAGLALMARLMGKPVVLTYHCDLRLPGGFIHAIANLVSNIANHITARVASLIVHNTRDYAVHSSFMGRYLDKLRPILPPVEVTPITPADLQAFQQKFKIEPGERIIGMAARLATEKGVEYLTAALPAVLQKFPTARVLFVGPYQNVVGEEGYAQRLLPLIDQYDEHWSFLGVVSPQELTAFYQTCDVTVLPSINSTESYGLVQVESMTCGTPVVASDLPGVRVPINMSQSGMIVPARDADALARALIKILENPATFQGDPETVVQRSTPEAVAMEYETVFESACYLQVKKSIDPVEPASSGAP
jgi:glycosyltransferase involved in cell wall biosynthesis